MRLLQFIGENPLREGLKETPRRFLSAWKEFTKGYNIEPISLLRSFKDGAESVDEMIVVRFHSLELLMSHTYHEGKSLGCPK